MTTNIHGDRVRIETVKPDPRNANTHDERSIAAIARSLKEFGQVKPIVVDAEGVVLAGNGTLAAAKSLGWESIWIVRTELAGAEARAYAIADNRTAELAEWNFGELNKQLDELRESSASLFDAAWFDPVMAIQLAESVEGGNDAAAEYQGMPEFTSENKKPWGQLTISFRSEDDFRRFAQLIEQPTVNLKTIGVYFPKLPHDRVSDIGYQDAS